MSLGAFSQWIGGFVNAGLVAGVALASVPLIIHLLNRQRHKPVRWVAMRFVLAAYRKTRRRVQMAVNVIRCAPGFFNKTAFDLAEEAGRDEILRALGGRNDC